MSNRLKHTNNAGQTSKNIRIAQATKPTYRIAREKGKYAVRKFVEFDHSWAVYSKPLDTFDTIHGAKEYVRLLELEDEEETNDQL